MEFDPASTYEMYGEPVKRDGLMIMTIPRNNPLNAVIVKIGGEQVKVEVSQ